MQGQKRKIRLIIPLTKHNLNQWFTGTKGAEASDNHHLTGEKRHSILFNGLNRVSLVGCFESRQPDAAALIPASVGSVGVAIFPGQSPAEVLLIAAIIDREVEVGAYPARHIARKVLLALANSRRDGSGKLEDQPNKPRICE